MVARRWVRPQTLWQFRPKDLCRLVPDVLALVGPTGVQLLVFYCVSISDISRCRVSSVVSSVYSFDFYFLGDVALTSRKPFTRTEQMSCVRKFGISPAPTLTHSIIFTDRSNVVLLLWFTISVIVCLCMYVLVISFILDSRLAYFWINNCPFGLLLVVFWLWCRYFKCTLLSLWCLGRKLLGNCIDSWSLLSTDDSINRIICNELQMD